MLLRFLPLPLFPQCLWRQLLRQCCLLGVDCTVGLAGQRVKSRFCYATGSVPKITVTSDFGHSSRVLPFQGPAHLKEYPV